MKRLILMLKSYFPSELPVGVKEFNKWADDVIELCGPIADRQSMVFALCTQIIHANATRSSYPKKHFVSLLRKSAANQVASHIFQEIKTAQKEAAEAAAKEEAEKQAAATAQEAVANVPEVP